MMDMQSVLESLEKASKDKKVKFISDQGKSGCDKCRQYDEKIFDIDDPNLSQLPMHPNCQCKYVSAANPNKDMSKDVEQHRIAQTLKEIHKLQENDAKSLAGQVTKARHENEKLREQKLFLLFNGRYLMSSDGKLLLGAVAGKIVSSEKKVDSATITGLVQSVRKIKFDYSYERQAIKNEGGLPQGLYSIACQESGSLINGNLIKHGRDWIAWGNYHWQLIPDEKTDTRDRGRNSFTIHGGLTLGSAGCIDLTSNDTKFRNYLKTLSTKNIYVYVRYDQEIVVWEDTKTRIYPIMPRMY